MQDENKPIKIAILGGGPAGLFMYKRIVESGKSNFTVDLFERKQQLGAGMPYSAEGSNMEHITNVSDNEIPKIVTSIEEWIKTAPKEIHEKFNITPDDFNEYKVLPRLLFGEYLSAQFALLKEEAKKLAITSNFHTESNVIDVIDYPEEDEIGVEVQGKGVFRFDKVIICTGHNWPKKHERTVEGYFDSPYPPSKLNLELNHPVAIKGSSLTAIDAIRTLARNNGEFGKKEDGTYYYRLSEKSPNFKIDIHSRSGMLPAVRFHLDDTHLQNDSLLTQEEMAAHRAKNGNFLSLDFLFEKNFKDLFKDKDPNLYGRIKNMKIEEFVALMMDKREREEPFQLLRAEYLEAEKSIKREQSIYWKEMLAVLSFAMNYPAKYLSAEDMLRLQKVLMPLISIVIAFVPQSSCRELLALHDAGVLDIIPVGDDSSVELNGKGGVVYYYTDHHNERAAVEYKTFVDCVGQPHLSFDEFPFQSLVSNQTVSPARLKFENAEAGYSAFLKNNNKVTRENNGDYYLEVPGITINDNFQVVDKYGCFNNRVYVMAVPYIGGFNPDYSGLDFCEEASGRIIKILHC